MHPAHVRSISAAFLTTVALAVPGPLAAQWGVPSFLQVGKEYSVLMASAADDGDFFDIMVVELGTDGWFKARQKDDEDEYFWINANALAVVVDLEERAALAASAQAEYEAGVALQESMLRATAPFVVRRLIDAQEDYYAEHGTYTVVLDAGIVRQDDAVAVEIVAADSTGWNAIVYSRHTGLSQCAISVGTGPATNSEIPEREIVCTNR